MKKVIKKHPLAIRWFHWINFPVLGVMVWSGTLIYWANDVYRIGWADKTILKFYPDSLYKALHMGFRLAEGMDYHFLFMWLFAINGLIYVFYLIFSGEWRLIVPGKNSLKESWQVVLHDLHLKKTAPPQKKYNAAQRIAYTGIIIMGFGSLLSGLAIYKPVQFHTLCALLGGYEWARAEHFILTILFMLFFIVHIVQVILAGWNNFRSMVTGLDVLPFANLQSAAVKDGVAASSPDNKMALAKDEPNNATDYTMANGVNLKQENAAGIAEEDGKSNEIKKEPDANDELTGDDDITKKEV